MRQYPKTFTKDLEDKLLSFSLKQREGFFCEVKSYILLSNQNKTVTGFKKGITVNYDINTSEFEQSKEYVQGCMTRGILTVEKYFRHYIQSL